MKRLVIRNDPNYLGGLRIDTFNSDGTADVSQCASVFIASANSEIFRLKKQLAMVEKQVAKVKRRSKK